MTNDTCFKFPDLFAARPIPKLSCCQREADEPVTGPDGTAVSARKPVLPSGDQSVAR